MLEETICDGRCHWKHDWENIGQIAAFSTTMINNDNLAQAYYNVIQPNKLYNLIVFGLLILQLGLTVLSPTDVGLRCRI